MNDRYRNTGFEPRYVGSGQNDTGNTDNLKDFLHYHGIKVLKIRPIRKLTNLPEITPTYHSAYENEIDKSLDTEIYHSQEYTLVADEENLNSLVRIQKERDHFYNDFEHYRNEFYFIRDELSVNKRKIREYEDFLENNHDVRQRFDEYLVYKKLTE